MLEVLRKIRAIRTSKCFEVRRGGAAKLRGKNISSPLSEALKNTST